MAFLDILHTSRTVRACVAVATFVAASCGPVSAKKVGPSPRAPSSASAPAPSEIAAAHTDEPRPAPPNASPATCEALRVVETERATQLLAEARAKLDAEHRLSLEGQDPWTVRAPVGMCVQTASGVWLFSLRSVEVTEWVELRFSLDHVNRRGERTSIIPTLKSDNDEDPRAFNTLASTPGEMHLSGKLVMLDGQEVFAVRIEGRFIEDVSFSRGRLFVAEAKKIVPYQPAERINVEDIVDIDGDGRLDLTTFAPFDSNAESCSSGFGYRITGPKLLAHGTGAGFTMDDEVTKRFVKRACPQRPSHVVVTTQGYPDTETAATNIACLALWGVDPGEIRRRVHAECSAIHPKAGDCSSSCDDRELDKWAAMKAPLDLSKR